MLKQWFKLEIPNSNHTQLGIQGLWVKKATWRVAPPKTHPRLDSKAFFIYHSSVDGRRWIEAMQLLEDVTLQ